jgi:uncharacterized membrane protein YqjE
MADSLSFITELFGAVVRLGGVGADLVGDRIELVALELRESKIRLVQALMLAFAAMALCFLGLALLILAVALALPPHWRLPGVVVMAGLSLLAGLWIYSTLRRRLSRWPLAFDQSLAELKKDKACF